MGLQEKGGVNTNGYGVFLRVMKCSKTDCGKTCTVLKNHLTVHLNWVNCMVDELHLNKVLIKKKKTGLCQRFFGMYQN